MPEEGPERRDANPAAALYDVGKLRVRSERDGVVHVVSFSGELDLAGAHEAETALKRAEATDALSIVLDLSELTFLDSTGVRVVLNACARSRADANRLTMLRGPRAVQRVFELCGITALLPFAD